MPHGRPHRGRRAPPWWPEGEHWPPRGPPWQTAPQHFRRRFLLGAAVVVVVLVGIGAAIGNGFGGGQADDHDRRGGPGSLLGLLGFVGVVGGGATVLAYKRISRPVSDLLEAAGRVAQGDYSVTVGPAGPRELRTLTATFNDMAARLADAEEQRRRFLADITHELRTPLAVLQSGIEAQIDDVHPRDDRHLGSLLEETQLLGRLVDDLHTLALADAGRLVLHYERAHLTALVEDAVDGHQTLAARKGVTVAASTRGAVPEVEVDPSRIRQVLDNLLSNAVRHAPPGTEVAVAVEATDDGLTVTVTDAGPGVAPDQLAHLFERFTRSADSRGSGLGLSIVRDLVQAHGGSVRAWNHPSGGAALSFTLPVDRSSPHS